MNLLTHCPLCGKELEDRKPNVHDPLEDKVDCRCEAYDSLCNKHGEPSFFGDHFD